MDLVTWDTSYSVKVKSSDDEHQVLFSLINALHDAMQSGKSRTIIAHIVRELEKYTQRHFFAEEALLRRARYPQLKDHRVEHQKFVAQIKQFKDDLDAGGKDDSIEVLTFLKDWLSHHIKQTDMMYSEHLNSHGIN